MKGIRRRWKRSPGIIGAKPKSARQRRRAEAKLARPPKPGRKDRAAK